MLRSQPISAALLLAFLVCLAHPLTAHAETKTITAEATYTMGDGETPSFADAQVLQRAKQIALEQAGTYVESYTRVQNLSLSVEEIQTIAGGVLTVEVLEKSRKLVGDGLQFYIKIRATVTTDDIATLAQRIRGKNIAEEYRKLQEDYGRLNKEMETWKSLLTKASQGPERDAAIAEIREREKALENARKNEAAIIQHLLSGEVLVASAVDQREQVDRLMATIKERGHVMSIGAVKAFPHETDEKTLVVTVPITLAIADTVPTLLSQTASALGGDPLPDLSLDRSRKRIRVHYAFSEKTAEGHNLRLRTKYQSCHDWPFEEYCGSTNPNLGAAFVIRTRGIPLHLSKNRRVEEYVRNQVSGLRLVVHLKFTDPGIKPLV